jgi:hypothetical protein
VFGATPSTPAVFIYAQTTEKAHLEHFALAFVCLCKALQREIQAINSSTCSEVSTKAASTGMWTAPPHVSRGVSAARNPRECGA